MDCSKPVHIIDTTIADRASAHGGPWDSASVKDAARCIEAAGAHTIEAGNPGARPGEAALVAAVASAVRSETAAVAHCNTAAVDAAAATLKDAAQPVIHVWADTAAGGRASGVSLEAPGASNERGARAAVLRAVDEAVRRARVHTPVVMFTAAGAAETERPFLRQCVLTAIEAGAARVAIADTPGCASPAAYAAMTADINALANGRAAVFAQGHAGRAHTASSLAAAVHGGAAGMAVTLAPYAIDTGVAALFTEVMKRLACHGAAAAGAVDSRRVEAAQAAIAEAFGVALAHAPAITEPTGVVQVLAGPAGMRGHPEAPRAIPA